MPRIGLAGQLSSMIKKLQTQRKNHADALEKIDGIFASIGVTTHLAPQAPRRGRASGKRGPGRPPKNGEAVALGVSSKRGRPGGRSKARRKFATPAPESVLAFVKAAGSKGATGAEISKHWKSEGRGAGEYVVIGKLVKDKKLKKQKIKDGRGSRYTAA